MDVAIIGVAGVCGRQLLFQLLSQGTLSTASRLQLVTHRGGDSEHELWGLRTDAASAFDESAPHMEIVLDPSDVRADLVVMMAGATVPTDPGASVDRAALGRVNAQIFRTYAEALAANGADPVVLIQSNPVEQGVAIFTEYLPRHRVLGAAALSDTGRFSRDVARGLGRRRRDVQGMVVGQHGDHMVPLWSQVAARGVSAQELAEYITRVRKGRALSDLPDEIRQGKARMIELVRAGEIETAYEYVDSLPPDTRTGVKPFFTHFTAGRTTEATTAYAAAWLTRQIVLGVPVMVGAQVRLEGDWAGVHGVTGAPVILSPTGWTRTVPMDIADDELALLHEAVAATG